MEASKGNAIPAALAGAAQLQAIVSSSVGVYDKGGEAHDTQPVP
jgi:hypothetical protein